MARRANALQTLLNQVNDLAPNRSKASDGWIGDAAHAAVTSQHNPNALGVVTAQDITHDPANGADMNTLAEQVIKDPRVWYVIWNKRIRYYGGAWEPYSGSNDHAKHMHISTKQDAANYDNGNKWNIGDNDMPATQEVVARLFLTYLGREAKPEDAHWIGKQTNDLVLTLESSDERKLYVDKIRQLIEQATGEKVSRESCLKYINENLK